MNRFVALAVFFLFQVGRAHALSPQQDALRQKAVTELFNLNFVDSRNQLRSLIALDPKDPFGYLFEAGILWWQASSEYGLFKDTPTLQGLFEQDVDDAIELSRRNFHSPDPKQAADSYFVSGMALGVRGQWNLSRGHYLKAYHDGKHAIKYLKKCLKIDPDYYDAYLGLGIFDYQTARLPRILRLPALFMVRGDAQRGIARLRDASEKGRLVSSQASAFLLSLLILDEHDYSQALPVLRSLRQGFPDSPYFQFVEIVLLDRLNDWEDSYREALSLFHESRQDPEILRRKQLSMLCGLPGPRCLDDQILKESVTWLDKALTAAEQAQSAKPQKTPLPHYAPEDVDARWPTLLHLYRALSYDILGRHDLASEDYRKLLQESDFARAHERAQLCLERGCDREMIMKMLKEMSLKDETPPPPVSAEGKKREFSDRDPE